MAEQKRNRREEILQALAAMLETSPGQRITTAKLAANLGVSEAALYRHFPSKARMFEGLIEFVEDTLLTRINMIMDEEKNTLSRCHAILQLLLTFAERNPGITRVMTGDALMGEHDRLRGRMEDLFNRIESSIKQILREKAMREQQRFIVDEAVLANLLLSYADGKISQFVRSNFKRLPTEHFSAQWQVMEQQLISA
ncbi:nucleoid occlusion factor SlmA [Idiomarina loihiensis]|jgi:TetR/AcrR family transcriptional regulator|uniref:Nucleoid occlusion factor SlmA n=1 Tax=Idiomarina loihiensis (strain ATCC BAA-735 / DSM 15497 / L2-TR) TaxID=283942 RepID=SLMA_IDILO|nr:MULTISPECIES: nucleoid occlusion factor SlmA [Idiomarina]Q5QZB7.1 RecName: Full=Nucleoid occlusion factor SlmA [Idiomarina loihiensis L2TR]MAA62173.1 nucleoid occlusion factor SlmA [Idiomarina sp.]NWO01867.1 nucleoid occlusion factor SlmA [Idiomarinaceae bacterium]AAV81080.1 Transcriptional regulator, TetR family [Idiomarina loihiensis L2TR]AGM35104.1 division inhibitor protein [Idiomarina loihiensis GSL 199]MBL4741395.1 nucleoid occlusion factor SlmA [Idiomarina sp.]|tara:strand:- start:220 stop:810 length:591 start_codon:yes stop_codon:yes gene_type:complete